MSILSNSLSIIGLHFLRLLAIRAIRDHNGNKAYKLLFLCNPCHQLSAIKDIVSLSLVFYC